MKKTSTFLFLSILFISGLLAQNVVSFAEGSEVKVDGSSTVSDWSVPVKQVEGKFLLPKDFAGKNNQKIKDILIVMEVKSMEGRGPDMNEKIFNAFKAEKNPQIIFEATEAICSESTGKTFKLSSKGQLKMAGQSHEVDLKLDGKETDTGYSFSGSQKIDMTAYGMEPPTAFFGSLEVEKEVTVIFNILINK